MSLFPLITRQTSKCNTVNCRYACWGGCIRFPGGPLHPRWWRHLPSSPVSNLWKRARIVLCLDENLPR